LAVPVDRNWISRNGKLIELMPPDIDIYRSAKLLIDQHGDEADIEAAMKADAMLEAGDIDGQRVWMRILDVIRELQKTKPDGSVH
jgi:hypothetical protein